MLLSTSFNALTVRTEAENAARLHYDSDGYLVRDEPLRNRVANLLRRVADAQLSLASKLDDRYAAVAA